MKPDDDTSTLGSAPSAARIAPTDASGLTVALPAKQKRPRLRQRERRGRSTVRAARGRHRSHGIAAHHQHDRVVGRCRAQRVDEIGRHLLDLAHAHVVRRTVVAQSDLGEADRVRLAEEVRALVVHLRDA